MDGELLDLSGGCVLQSAVLLITELSMWVIKIHCTHEVIIKKNVVIKQNTRCEVVGSD